LKNNASLKVVDTLLRFNFSAASLNNFGYWSRGCRYGENLPIHNAMKNNASFEVVEALLRDYPSTAPPKNNWDLPLHIALENNASFEVVDALLRDYPSATS
jgi:hypothetical protein